MSGKLDGLEHFAATAIEIAGRADALRELCVHVMRTGGGLGRRPLGDAWFDIWGNAFADRGSADLRRRMDLVRWFWYPTPGVPEWVDVSELADLLIERGALLRYAPAYARAWTESAGSSSGGSSRGS